MSRWIAVKHNGCWYIDQRTACVPETVRDCILIPSIHFVPVSYRQDVAAMFLWQESPVPYRGYRTYLLPVSQTLYRPKQARGM
ncbi:hypothetical protein BaRGS_00005105 [Batillaria attramentaria]|uniref:Uncharacterized protein n=1 Tax=Batillaria attramentaria TaxID=370345 RepID=A0ABD0LWS4_9CAEN